MLLKCKLEVQNWILILITWNSLHFCSFSVLKNSEMLPSPKNTSFKLSESILHFGNANLTKSSSTISGESDTNIRHSSPRECLYLQRRDIEFLWRSIIFDYFEKWSAFSNGNFDDTYSDSVSRTVSSALSDESAPVLGRRAQRMKQLSNSGSIYPLHSNLSDSDRSDVDTTVTNICTLHLVNYTMKTTCWFT